MGVSVLIQSTTRNDLTGRDGVTITKALRTIPTATIRTVDPAGSFLPGVGNQVEIQDDLGGPTVTLFGGSISEVERIRRRTSIATLETNCACVGKADRLERRLAGYYEFTGKTAGYILGQLVANSLSGDISIASPSGIATGPTIESLVWDYPTAKDAADSVVNLSPGYEYYIKPDGTFSYFQTSSNTCPVSITTGANVNKITTRETREDFCNRVTIKVANALRDPDTENFTGDGATQSFNVAYPIAQAPEIFVGSPAVAQTVGIIGVDTGKDWYWQEGSTEIRQEDTDTPIGSSVVIMVTYVGTESILVSAVNTASVSARATAESNSGIYHKLTLENKLTRANAQAVADAYVDRYSSLSVVMQFETDTRLEPDAYNIEPGQTLTVSLTGYNCAGTYLVRSVTLQLRINDVHQARWVVKVEAVSGPVLRNYVDVFRDTSGGGGNITGSGSIASSTGGAGTYVYEPAKLTANTTITAPIPATSGATMVIFVKQGAGPYTISFNATQFSQIVNTAIPAVEDMEIAFPFVGRGDGLWWPMSFAREMS